MIDGKTVIMASSTLVIFTNARSQGDLLLLMRWARRGSASACRPAGGVAAALGPTIAAQAHAWGRGGGPRGLLLGRWPQAAAAAVLLTHKQARAEVHGMSARGARPGTTAWSGAGTERKGRPDLLQTKRRGFHGELTGDEKEVVGKQPNGDGFAEWNT
jgi:hypothetical protein